jgi:hypothetical protein
MYLTAKKHLFQFREGDKLLADKIKEIFNIEANCSEVSFMVGYWRKSNAIHNWFVQNVQDGVDNCKEFNVSQEKLIELLKLVKKVLKDKSKAEELLPTQSGFFFGDTEYNEYYFSDLEDTKKILEKSIKLGESFEFYYQSSW